MVIGYGSDVEAHLRFFLNRQCAVYKSMWNTKSQKSFTTEKLHIHIFAHANASKYLVLLNLT